MIHKIFFFLFITLFLSCSDDKSVDVVDIDPTKTASEATPEATKQAPEPDVDLPKIVVDPPEPEYLEGKILPNKGFEAALLAIPGIDLHKHVLKIVNKLRFSVDLRFLRAGEDFKVKLSKDKSKVIEFIYTPNIITFHKLILNEKSGEFEYKKEILSTDIVHRIVTGEIETTLNQALIDKEGVSNGIRSVVNGILECIVNFRTDARKKDRYTILIEDKYYKGSRVPGGKVLYASYNGVRAGLSEAYNYQEDDSASAFNGHYTKKGKALDDGNGNKIGYMVSAKGAYLYLTSPHLPTGTSGENMIPLVGIGYKLAAGPAEVTVGGAFHSVKPLTKDDDAITSFLGHANVSATFGIVSVLANFGYAVNPGNMGLNGLPKGSGDGAKDTSMIDALAEVGVQAGPGVARVGFGMKRNDNGADADNTTTDKAYYVHYDLDINKYIKIAPEVSIHDMDGGDKTTFIGVFTRMKM